jgi:hypothetical protein
MKTKQFLCKSPWYILLLGKEGFEVFIYNGMIEVYSLRLFRFKKRVNSFPVHDVLNVRMIENLVLSDTLIALTKNRVCFLQNLRPREAFGFKNFVSLML